MFRKNNPTPYTPKQFKNNSEQKQLHVFIPELYFARETNKSMAQKFKCV